MMTTLKVYCPYCGTNLTQKTVSEIMKHFQDEHKMTLLDAVYAALRDTFSNELVEVDE